MDTGYAIEENLRNIAAASVINVSKMAEELGNPKVIDLNIAAFKEGMEIA